MTNYTSANSGANYQMQPYDGLNVFHNTGTFTVATPARYSEIAFLATTQNNNGNPVTNPLFPALQSSPTAVAGRDLGVKRLLPAGRSGPTTAPGASLQKQILAAIGQAVLIQL
jgi:hypothetical protein